SIGYSFKDKSHIVKAFTHSSYYDNTITGCYQRLEFLGDAVLDYLITRYIFEDKKEFNPGELTDLRQALVNNSYFGCLAVKYCFHKYLKYLSCTGMGIIDAFDKKFKSNEKEIIYGHFLLINENETEQSEDVEVPKILGDIFESVAGAIYLDSGFSLDAVWKVYYPLIKSELEYFSENVPLHPIRMLYEADEKTKFEKAIVLDSKRVIVNLWFRGELYEGEGRNTKFAKIVAAKKAVKTIAKVAV
ncbi:Endoribonuclease Dcr-1-like protein, partial [Dinothrombium tinctorium]